MMQTMFEKLQLTEEKNLLIQGLPSSIEKQFTKIAFAKNVTPLLRSRRIDFALIFAINETQLNGILKEVLPALDEEGKLWIAYPKTTSKIVSDLNRDCTWQMLHQNGFESEYQVTLDHVWTALRFKKPVHVRELIPFTKKNTDTVATTVQHKARSSRYASSGRTANVAGGK
mgnify:FL=1